MTPWVILGSKALTNQEPKITGFQDSVFFLEMPHSFNFLFLNNNIANKRAYFGIFQ